MDKLNMFVAGMCFIALINEAINPERKYPSWIIFFTVFTLLNLWGGLN